MNPTTGKLTGINVSVEKWNDTHKNINSLPISNPPETGVSGAGGIGILYPNYLNYYSYVRSHDYTILIDMITSLNIKISELEKTINSMNKKSSISDEDIELLKSIKTLISKKVE